jgi:PIN domain nuclease of toxin-antitoxin system
MYVIDTHVLVWANLSPNKLSDKAKEILSVAGNLFVPSISLWEISMLVSYGRLELPCHPTQDR